MWNVKCTIHLLNEIHKVYSLRPIARSVNDNISSLTIETSVQFVDGLLDGLPYLVNGVECDQWMSVCPPLPSATTAADGTARCDHSREECADNGNEKRTQTDDQQNGQNIVEVGLLNSAAIIAVEEVFSGDSRHRTSFTEGIVGWLQFEQDLRVLLLRESREFVCVWRPTAPVVCREQTGHCEDGCHQRRDEETHC